MSYISISQAFAQWQELAESIPKDDGPALAESWNDYTDSLCKDGELCDLQYQYCPAYDDPMPGAGSRFDALSDDREFILDAMGVTMSAKFVPFSQSRNKAETSPSLNWVVTLKYNRRDVIETDYMQGCGHCPAYKNPSTFAGGKRDEHSTRVAIARECETGKRNAGGSIPAPDLADVLHSLMCDATAIDSRDFADWCADMGADNDSISARATYDACIATATRLRAAFGESKLRKLYELFEDM